MDSKEEIVFIEWLDELVEGGFVNTYTYHIDKYELIPKAVLTTDKNKQISLLNNLSYTPDFTINWNESSKGLFYVDIEEVQNSKFDNNQIILSSSGVSTIDIKGSFVGLHNNSGITFPIIRKVLYHLKGIYVNKVVPKELFKNTFTPMSYLKTATNKPRKIDWQVRTLAEYTNANRK